MNCKGYADLGDMKEDQRIDVIGKSIMAMEVGRTIAFVTDSEPGKADRYIRKLTTKFPSIEVVSRFDGPVKDSVTVKIRRRTDTN